MKLMLILVAVLAFAGSTGFLTATAINNAVSPPTRTVTIDVGTGSPGAPGPPGPAGPKGDPGAPGAESCPAGYTFSALVINHPGGQTQIATCIKN